MHNPSQPFPPKKLSHVDESGKALMVDVGPKTATERMAVVTGSVLMQPETLKLIESNAIEKGDVLGVARIAGIMAAKNTAQLIPLCHPLPLDQVNVEFRLDHERSSVDIRATARTTAKTGVEMEAMTAVSVAALTIYDMCKAVDRGMRIGDIRLRRKTGGKRRAATSPSNNRGLCQFSSISKPPATAPNHPSFRRRPESRKYGPAQTCRPLP